jgi:hypothetical protein
MYSYGWLRGEGYAISGTSERCDSMQTVLRPEGGVRFGKTRWGTKKIWKKGRGVKYHNKIQNFLIISKSHVSYLLLLIYDTKVFSKILVKA